MTETQSAHRTATTAPPVVVDRQVHARIKAEFREMPGMRLTLRQASRLFNLEPAHCALVLQALVDAGTLWTNGREFLGSNVGRRFA